MVYFGFMRFRSVCSLQDAATYLIGPFLSEATSSSMGTNSSDSSSSIMTGLWRGGGLPLSVFRVSFMLGPSPMELNADNSISYLVWGTRSCSVCDWRPGETASSFTSRLCDNCFSSPLSLYDLEPEYVSCRWERESNKTLELHQVRTMEMITVSEVCIPVLN